MGDRSRFFMRLLRSKWLVVVAAIWIQCSSGSTYSFSIYSQTIKDTFIYGQKGLDILASWKDLGGNVGIISGLVFDWSSPRAVLAIGAVENWIAYIAIWLSVTGQVATPAFWQMGMYMFLAANSQTFFSTACVVTCVQNFPRNRGVVIGLMKGLLGLSGAILTELYHAVYGNEPSSYLLMAAWLPSVLTLCLIGIVRPIPAHEDRHESRSLIILSFIAVSLAAFLMGIILLDHMMNITHAGYMAIGVILCGMLLLPLGVVVKSELEAESSTLPSLKEPLLHPASVAVPTKDGDGESGRTLTDAEAGIGRKGSSSDVEPIIRSESDYHIEEIRTGKTPCRGEDHTIFEAFLKVDFWLLCLAMACGMGSGLTAIDNTGQIGASLGYSLAEVRAFISLFSIWNFLGRLGFGALSELCLQRYKIGRPVLLACSQALMSVGYLMISSALPNSLYPALVLVGLCYGAQWSLMPAITSELFGLSRFASLFNIISIASPIGSYLFSVQVLGRIYDNAAAKHYPSLNLEDLQCHGASCFRLTFVILAGATLFGGAVCSVLARRTKSFYSRVL